MLRGATTALVLLVAFDARAAAAQQEAPRGPGAQQEAPRAPVSVDWSGVSDAHVERCGLSRLRAGTLERLVDQGHAVVDAIADDGIAVRVASSGAHLQVDVQSGSIARTQAFAVEPDCDATFVLHVIARIAELVAEVARTRPPARARRPAEAAAGPSAPQERPPLQASLGLAARASTASARLLGGSAAVRLRAPARLEAGVRLELTFAERDGVSLLEGFAGPLVALRPSGSILGAYLELGPLLHAASSDRRDATELDGALAAGLELSLGHVAAQLLAQLRLRRLEHRLDERKVFDTGHFGVVLRVAGQLSGS